MYSTAICITAFLIVAIATIDQINNSVKLNEAKGAGNKDVLVYKRKRLNNKII